MKSEYSYLNHQKTASFGVLSTERIAAMLFYVTNTVLELDPHTTYSYPLFTIEKNSNNPVGICAQERKMRLVPGTLF